MNLKNLLDKLLKEGKIKRQKNIGFLQKNISKEKILN